MLTVSGTTQSEDQPHLLDRPRVLFDARGVEPTLLMVDCLARMALAARRSRSELRLWRPSAELLALIEAMGLADVLRE